MESALVKHNPHWQDRPPDLLERDLLQGLIKKLDLRHIQVLKVLRCSGKTNSYQHGYMK